ncbi:hypothetical protein CCC_01607 [Paramagnetospirillum magnetotacticum MS-1]|uniref:Uncharacterized protein n=1 Tax=Paramagnetospirillum magnetotacticum MS-1 TaxID=272627 RepID=A0A0C2UV90_PARME|nr:hypothetical protein CCC_01607 [Paramagnetospirillum magnetotacticum MS-1]
MPCHFQFGGGYESDNQRTIWQTLLGLTGVEEKFSGIVSSIGREFPSGLKRFILE